MDQRFTSRLANPLGLQSIHCTRPESLAEARAKALPFLRNRKMAKFMGKQDFMAVSAAGEAISAINLSAEELQNETGLYLCTGYIPFQKDDIDVLALNSEEDGQLSMQRFSTDGVNNVNPLLTFRCLPNMPSFHISVNFEIQKASFTTYPGTGQFYSGLEQAIYDLQSESIKYALVGAVADQKNFLVKNLFERLNIKDQISDAAFFVVLTQAPALYNLTGIQLSYKPADLLEKRHCSKIETSTESGILSPIKENLGAAISGFQLQGAMATGARKINLTATTFDGYQCYSEWRQL